MGLKENLVLCLCNGVSGETVAHFSNSRGKLIDNSYVLVAIVEFGENSVSVVIKCLRIKICFWLIFVLF